MSITDNSEFSLLQQILRFSDFHLDVLDVKIDQVRPGALSRNESEMDFRDKQLRARRNVTGTYKTRLRTTRDY